MIDGSILSSICTHKATALSHSLPHVSLYEFFSLQHIINDLFCSQWKIAIATSKRILQPNVGVQKGISYNSRKTLSIKSADIKIRWTTESERKSKRVHALRASWKIHQIIDCIVSLWTKNPTFAAAKRNRHTHTHTYPTTYTNANQIICRMQQWKINQMKMYLPISGCIEHKRASNRTAQIEFALSVCVVISSNGSHFTEQSSNWYYNHRVWCVFLSVAVNTNGYERSFIYRRSISLRFCHECNEQLFESIYHFRWLKMLSASIYKCSQLHSNISIKYSMNIWSHYPSIWWRWILENIFR